MALLWHPAGTLAEPSIPRVTHVYSCLTGNHDDCRNAGEECSLLSASQRPDIRDAVSMSAQLGLDTERSVGLCRTEMRRDRVFSGPQLRTGHSDSITNERS